jgi:hypothetical protein
MEPQMNHPGDMLNEVYKATKQIYRDKKFPFLFAAFKDTTVRPMSQQQQRQELLLIKGKLDSAKRKVDSLNKIINKQQPQTKT